MLANNIMGQFSEQLCDTLVMQICGEAARSDLDHLSEPFLKLFQHSPDTRKMLEKKLIEFPTNATSEYRREFEAMVKKMAMTATSYVLSLCRCFAISTDYNLVCVAV